MTPEAERFNGWAAMLGFVAAVGAYVTTGQIIPGWFQILINRSAKRRSNQYQVIANFSNYILITLLDSLTLKLKTFSSKEPQCI